MGLLNRLPLELANNLFAKAKELLKYAQVKTLDSSVRGCDRKGFEGVRWRTQLISQGNAYITLPGMRLGP